MYGAIIGDIVGSKYEFNNIKTKNFPFISKGCKFTDDTVMTIAVAKALLKTYSEKSDLYTNIFLKMQKLGKTYPDAGYGNRFRSWLNSDNPKPYNSFGNGSAMRVSPCGLFALTLKEALDLAEASSLISHNHPEGIKGAKATSAAIFLAKSGYSKEEIKKYIEDNFYDLSMTLDEIRPTYKFNESCQKTVPQAIVAFLESKDYIDAIRNAISLGGDSDTLAAITGSIAYSYYRYNNSKDSNIEKIVKEYKIDNYLPIDFIDTIKEFEMTRIKREEEYKKQAILFR